MNYRIKNLMALMGSALLGHHPTMATSHPSPNDFHQGSNDSFLSKLGSSLESNRVQTRANKDNHDQPAYIGFSLDNYQVDETAGVATLEIKSDLCPVSVKYSSRNGTAIEEDYRAVTGTLLLTTDSSGNCAPGYLSIPITDDSIREKSETIHLTLSDPSTGVELDQNQAVLTIIDNESSTIGFSQLNYEVDESDESATIAIERIDCIDGFTPSAKVTALVVEGYYGGYSYYKNGTGTSGSDYSAPYLDHEGQPLTWNEGECGEKSFEMNIFDDLSIEGDETVLLFLIQPSGANLHQEEAILTIVDNDNSVVLGFSEEAYQVDEGKMAEISLKHIGCGYQSPIVSVSYSSRDDTATQEDYATVKGIFVGGKGVNCNWHFKVPTIDDTLLEENETLYLKLTDPSKDVKLDISEAILTIIDNDSNIIGFSQENYSVNEDEQSATITVERTNCIKDNPVSVDYHSESYTAVSSDYINVNGQLSWEDDQCTPLTFEMAITDDDEVEEDEIVKLFLDQLSLGAIFGRNTATLTIIDNDHTDSEVVKEMRVEIDLNQTRYTVGDPFVAHLDTQGTGIADLYVAIVFPEGYFLTLREFLFDSIKEEWRIRWSFLNTPQPYWSFRTADIDSGWHPIIDLRWPPHLPVGDYSVCGILVHPDTIDLLDQNHWIHWDCSAFQVYN